MASQHGVLRRPQLRQHAPQGPTVWLTEAVPIAATANTPATSTAPVSEPPAATAVKMAAEGGA
jgi:hypothetical protein